MTPPVGPSAEGPEGPPAPASPAGTAPGAAGTVGDNPAAIAFFEGWSGTPDFADPRTGQPDPALREEWIRRMVEQHRHLYREGFMILWRDEAPATRYRHPGVELSILYEQRFGLSFPPRGWGRLETPHDLLVRRRRVRHLRKGRGAEGCRAAHLLRGGVPLIEAESCSRETRRG